MAKNEKHYKTRQVVAQAVGNTGAQAARRGIRNAAEQGLKRMAAHEKATRDLARLGKAATSDYDRILARQQQQITVSRTRANENIRQVLDGADQRLADVQAEAAKAARNRTSQMEQALQRRAMDARAAGQKAYDARMSASKGVWRDPTSPGLPKDPKYNPVRTAEAAGNRARITQGRALNDLKRLRAQAPAREAAEVRRAVDQAARGIEKEANQFVKIARTDEKVIAGQTRRATQQLQQRFNAAATRVMEKAGPKATFFQRAAAKMSQVGKPLAGSAVENVAATTTEAAAKKGLGLFASRAEIAARVGELAKTSPKTAAAIRRTGLIAEGMYKKGGGFIVNNAKRVGRNLFGLRLPSRVIAGGLNKIEAAGKLVAGSGKMGKVVTGLTNATGLAGGFAVGAWIDAGLNWAEASADAKKMGYTGFFGKGGMWEALGSVNRTEVVRDEKTGQEHIVDYRNPTLGNVVTSKEYWGEVTRGTLRNLTFGIFGQDKYGWEQDQRSQEERSKQENEWYLSGLDSQGRVIRDRNGNDISHILARQRRAAQDMADRANNIAAYFMSFDPANKDKISKGWNASKGGEALGFAANAQTDAVGFIAAVKHLGELKDQQIEATRQMAVQGGQNRHVDRVINAKMRRGLAREQAVEEYMQEFSRSQDREYEKRLGMMLKSDAAAKASNMNRNYAYLALTGRDYDVDTKSDLAEGAKRGYADFNAAWGEMSDRDRVLFDRDAFGKSIAESATSEYKALTGTQEEEVPDGDAAKPAA